MVRKMSLMLAVAMLGVMTLGGCKNTTKAENEALWKENKELHDELKNSRDALEAANATLAKMQQEQAAKAAGAPGSGASEIGKLAGGGVTVKEENGQATINVAGDVLFDSGKATLKTTAQAKLKQVAAALVKEGRGTIRVEGHTDSDPIKKSGWRDNYHLSEARATAVRDFLANNGVSRTSMSIIGHGPDKEVASNATKAGKAQNRRVEIIVVTQ